MLKLIRRLGIWIFLLFLLYSLTQGIFNYQKKMGFFEDYKKDYVKEVDKNKKLKSEIVKRDDYDIVEKDIRTKLNLLKPGEVAIILPRLSPTPTPTPEVKKPPAVQWWELFIR